MKAYIFALSFVLLLLAEGTGAWFKWILGIDRHGFNAPVGFALLLAASQVLYYPAQLFQYSFHWILVSTGIILIAAVFFVIYDLPDMKASLLRPDSLLVLGAGAVFIFLCAGHDVVSITPGDNPFPKMMMDVKAPQFQGYFHFALAFARYLNLSCGFFGLAPVGYGAAQIYGMGLLYVLMSSMLIVDIVRRRELRNHWFEFALGIYLLMNGNYTAWNPDTAWLGRSWAVLFTTMAVYTGYRYLKEENEMTKYLWLPIMTAGLACDNSFGLSGIAVLYGFMVYLFSVHKIRSLFDLFTFVIPHVAYMAAVLASRWWPPLSVFLVMFYAWFSFRRYKRPIRRWIARAEEFCFDHYKELFLIAVPAVLTVASLIISAMQGWKGISSYTYYFSDFTEIDGMRDYLLIHSGILQIALNVFRWGGLVCLFWLAKEPCDRGIRVVLEAVLLVFLNPLCTPAISYMTGPMFIHTFHVLFNPFTEALLFLYVYRMFQWTVIGQWVLEILLCLGAFLGILGIR